MTLTSDVKQRKQRRQKKESYTHFIGVPMKNIEMSLTGHVLADMLTRELNYADNWNFAKVYCSFSVIDASGILAQSFSSQSKLSKELSIFEIR